MNIFTYMQGADIDAKRTKMQVNLDGDGDMADNDELAEDDEEEGFQWTKVLLINYYLHVSVTQRIESLPYS